MLVDFSNKMLYNEKFIPLLKNEKRYEFLMGGGGSGKSVFISQKKIIKSFKTKNKIMCVRKVKDTIKDSMFAELRARIKDRSLQSYFTITTSPMSITNNLTGCRFIFRGVDDPEKLKSVEGVEDVRIEEATELTREDFDQIDLRLRGKGAIQISCTFNPTDAEHRLNTDFWVNGETKDQICLHSTYKDNRWVGEEYATVMDRLFETNSNYYNIYALGKWGILEGLIFENREPIKEVPENANLVGYGLDFGYTNDPTCLVGVYQFNNDLILDEMIYERGLTNVFKDESEKERSIVGKLQSLGIDEYETIRADSSEPKSIDEIFSHGYNIKPVEKGKDSISFGLDIMQQFKIKITAKSGNLQKEFKKYVWAKDKNGKPLNKPIDAYNHGIDASRYCCMMGIGKTKDLELFIG